MTTTEDSLKHLNNNEAMVCTGSLPRLFYENGEATETMGCEVGRDIIPKLTKHPYALKSCLSLFLTA